MFRKQIFRKRRIKKQNRQIHFFSQMKYRFFSCIFFYCCRWSLKSKLDTRLYVEYTCEFRLRFDSVKQLVSAVNLFLLSLSLSVSLILKKYSFCPIKRIEVKQLKNKILNTYIEVNASVERTISSLLLFLLFGCCCWCFHFIFVQSEYSTAQVARLSIWLPILKRKKFIYKERNNFKITVSIIWFRSVLLLVLLLMLLLLLLTIAVVGCPCLCRITQVGFDLKSFQFETVRKRPSANKHLLI